MKLFLLMVILIVVIFVPMTQAETPVDSTAYLSGDMTMIYSSAEWNGGGRSSGKWKFISGTGKWKGITGGGREYQIACPIKYTRYYSKL
jgi:hypothetical protein